MITKVTFENFTAFKDLTMRFSPGINVLIGENGTGKTHIMKALYAACSVIDTKEELGFDQKLKLVFLPNSIGRLVHRSVGRSSGKVTVYRKNDGEASERYISCLMTTLNRVEINKRLWIEDKRTPATYIPVKDMLANAPGFRALYSEKHIHFEEIYSDIIDKAMQPVPRGKQSENRARLLRILHQAISGKVIEKNEQFYLKNKLGELEFTLLAEGYRKLGLLYALIQNETLTKGSVLFWDEPEANLNPKLARTVVNILVELQKIGVQVIVATHDYVFLKEFDLTSTKDTSIFYHTLYKDDENEIACFTTQVFDELEPNAIDDAHQSLLDREITKQLNHRL